MKDTVRKKCQKTKGKNIKKDKLKKKKKKDNNVKKMQEPKSKDKSIGANFTKK